MRLRAWAPSITSPFTGGYEVFTQGEFVFTTLGFAGVHPDLAEEALLALIECGVAAVAVKPVVLKELPPTVVQASAARGVPCSSTRGAIWNGSSPTS